MLESPYMSALLSAHWDWSNGPASNKQTAKQEAFKLSPTRLAAVGGDARAYPFDTVDTRLRIPGRGRSLVVRYESSPGKDFILLGHTIVGIETTESESRS